MLRITEPKTRRHEEYDVRETELLSALHRERLAREARGAPRGRVAVLLATALRAVAAWLADEPERRATARQPST